MVLRGEPMSSAGRCAEWKVFHGRWQDLVADGDDGVPVAKTDGWRGEFRPGML